MAQERVNFWRGLKANVPDDIQSGRIGFIEDTGDVFLDFRSRQDGEYHRVMLTDTRKFDKAGGTFEGPVLLMRLPEEEMEAVPKEYVDKADADASKALSDHVNDMVAHITDEERETWNDKVDKADGYGLSKNDLTDELLEKLNGISDEATRVSIDLPDMDASESTIVATVTIDGESYAIMVPDVVDIPGNAATASELESPPLIDGFRFNGRADVMRYVTCFNLEGSYDLTVAVDNFEFADSALLFVDLRNGLLGTDNPYTLTVLDASTGDAIASCELEYRGQTVQSTATNADKYPRGNYIIAASVDTNTFNILHKPTEYELATTFNNGLMSYVDKAKLDSIADGAFAYELPPATEDTLGGVIVGENVSVDDGTISVTGDDVVNALGYTPVNGDDVIGSLDIFSGTESPGLVPPNTLPPNQVAYLDSRGTWSSTTVPVFSAPYWSNFSDAELFPDFDYESEQQENWPYHWVDGQSGLVPAPPSPKDPTDEDAELALTFLGSDGAWHSVEGGSGGSIGDPISDEEILALIDQMTEGVSWIEMMVPIPDTEIAKAIYLTWHQGPIAPEVPVEPEPEEPEETESENSSEVG